MLAGALTPAARLDYPRLSLAELGFFLMTAGFVAVAVRSVGLLLISGLMIMSAAAARPLSGSPGGMVLRAMVVGAAGVLSGLGASLAWDVPAAPAMVAAAGVLFVGCWGWAGVRGRGK